MAEAPNQSGEDPTAPPPPARELHYFRKPPKPGKARPGRLEPLSTWQMIGLTVVVLLILGLAGMTLGWWFTAMRH